MEFRLYPLATAYAGWFIWPWERSEEVLRAWAEWTRTVPEQMTSIGRILQIPDLPNSPYLFSAVRLRLGYLFSDVHVSVTRLWLERHTCEQEALSLRALSHRPGLRLIWYAVHYLPPHIPDTSSNTPEPPN